MRSEFVLLVIIGGFFSALIFFLIIVYHPTIPFTLIQSSNSKISEAVSSDKDVVNDLRSKIKWLEEQQKNQIESFADLKKYTSTQSAQIITPSTNNKSIYSVAYTKGSLFTTSSSAYSPMGMYINIKCPKDCLLWISFYTSSQNIATSTSSQGNVNTYDIFLNGGDQSIYSQATYPVASTSIPVSLNAVIPVSAGVHTVEIKAKTSGGTLQSDSSALQVMAIEK